MNEKDPGNPTKGIRSGHSRSGLEKMTEHDLVNVSLKDFLAIVLDAEGPKRRHELVGKKSSIRGFLLFKLTFLTRIKRRFSFEDREKLKMEKATLLYQMMKEDENFFDGFNCKSERVIEVSTPIKIEPAKVDVLAKKCKGASYKLSLEQLARFSMTSVDITHMLSVPVWMIITAHIFRDHLARKNPIFLDDLIREGFSFSRMLVDTVVSRNGILTDRQKSVLASVLKGEGGAEAIKNAENIFFNMDLANAVLVPQTLNKLRLNDKFVGMLTGIPLSKLRLDNSLWSKSIFITVASGSEYALSVSRMSAHCPLKDRCRKVIERFFKGDSPYRLSCGQCPLRDKHKRQGEESSFGVSSQRDFFVY